jgi:hypothetical protein
MITVWCPYDGEPCAMPACIESGQCGYMSSRVGFRIIIPPMSAAAAKRAESKARRAHRLKKRFAQILSELRFILWRATNRRS